MPLSQVKVGHFKIKMPLFPLEVTSQNFDFFKNVTVLLKKFTIRNL